MTNTLSFSSPARLFGPAANLLEQRYGKRLERNNDGLLTLFWPAVTTRDTILLVPRACARGTRVCALPALCGLPVRFRSERLASSVLLLPQGFGDEGEEFCGRQPRSRQPVRNHKATFV